MNVLEKKGISVATRSGIWKQHFSEGFAIGSRELTYEQAKEILQQARDIDRALPAQEELRSPTALTRKVRRELASRLNDHGNRDQDLAAIRTNIGSLKQAWLKVKPGTGNPKTPKNQTEAQENRVEIYQLMRHLTVCYGTPVAQQIWDSKLEQRAAVGLGLEAGRSTKSMRKPPRQVLLDQDGP